MKAKKNLIRVITVLATLVLCLMAAHTASTAEPVKVFLYGSELEFDVPPQIISGYTMVPMRTIIESITGSEVEWDADTRTITFYTGDDKSGGKKCTHKVGESIVYIDGKPVEFAAPSVVISGRTLVPARMIAESTGKKIDWDAAQRFVLITEADGAAATEPSAKPSEIKLETISHDVAVKAPAESPDESKTIGSYQEPVFSGFGDTELEKATATSFLTEIQMAVAEIAEYYDSLLDDINNEEDEELKKSFEGFEEQFSFISEMHLITTANGVYCAAAELRYEFTGGAHPMTYVNMSSVDIAEKKLVTLGGIFKDDTYKDVIGKKLADMAKTDKYKELILPEAELYVSDDTSFFLSEDKLVIYYQPYDVGPYAAGYIVFEIPFDEIKDIMKDKYLDAEYKIHISSDDLFTTSLQELGK